MGLDIIIRACASEKKLKKYPVLDGLPSHQYAAWQVKHWRKEYELMNSFIEVFQKELRQDISNGGVFDLWPERFEQVINHFAKVYIREEVKPVSKVWPSTKGWYDSKEEYWGHLVDILTESQRLLAFMRKYDDYSYTIEGNF